jgi:hypothetical protein
MKMTIKGYIVAYFSRYAKPGDPPQYSFQAWEPDSKDYVLITPHEHEVEFEVPDNFIPARVAVMEKAIAKIHLEAEEEVVEIKEEIQKLLCLESSV